MPPEKYVQIGNFNISLNFQAMAWKISAWFPNSCFNLPFWICVKFSSHGLKNFTHGYYAVRCMSLNPMSSLCSLCPLCQRDSTYCAKERERSLIPMEAPGQTKQGRTGGNPRPAALASAPLRRTTGPMGVSGQCRSETSEGDARREQSDAMQWLGVESPPYPLPVHIGQHSPGGG